ncbi:MAG: hypothetical protein Q7J10_09575 [Methanosarcinaceae archaeon]|nr:hypothetical protein [Methanosarcinaceae archaeon]
MEIETSIRIILGIISIVIMFIAMYYGIALKTRLPKELLSLNLIIYALLLMVIQRIFHVFADFNAFWFMIVIDDITSIIIAILMLLAFKRMYSKLVKDTHH